ncbi:hypothetical protein ACUODJ_58530, partial [Escherichia sp. HC-CC]
QLANGGNSREEYFIEGTQPTQQAVHFVSKLKRRRSAFLIRTIPVPRHYR